MNKEDVTFINCLLKHDEHITATTITTAASCVSSRLKVKTYRNFRAPETHENYITKISAIITINCGLRNSELTYLNANDITFVTQWYSNSFLKQSKTESAGKGLSFVVSLNPKSKIMRDYMFQNV